MIKEKKNIKGTFTAFAFCAVLLVLVVLLENISLIVPNVPKILKPTSQLFTVLKKGAAKRRVRLPAGKWASWRGEVFEGPADVELDVTLADLPRFERL